MGKLPQVTFFVSIPIVLIRLCTEEWPGRVCVSGSAVYAVTSSSSSSLKGNVAYSNNVSARTTKTCTVSDVGYGKREKNKC